MIPDQVLRAVEQELLKQGPDPDPSHVNVEQVADALRRQESEQIVAFTREGCPNPRWMSSAEDFARLLDTWALRGAVPRFRMVPLKDLEDQIPYPERKSDREYIDYVAKKMCAGETVWPVEGHEALHYSDVPRLDVGGWEWSEGAYAMNAAANIGLTMVPVVELLAPRYIDPMRGGTRLAEKLRQQGWEERHYGDHVVMLPPGYRADLDPRTHEGKGWV